jgi:hypothetical protein
MNDQTKRDIARLRLLIGYLGERGQFGWWDTDFFNPVAGQFLTPVFGRTALLSQYHGVVEAARRHHDERLSASCYHLFRLPEEIEHALHDLVLAGIDAETMQAVSSGREAALTALRKVAGDESRDSDTGPVLIGTGDSVGTARWARMTAAVYLNAFDKGIQGYPYWVSK